MLHLNLIKTPNRGIVSGACCSQMYLGLWRLKGWDVLMTPAAVNSGANEAVPPYLSLTFQYGLEPLPCPMPSDAARPV